MYKVEVPQRSLQSTLVKAIRKLFPAERTEDWKPPILEDLVNQQPFTLFAEWLEQRQLEADEALVPALLTRASRGWRAAAEQDHKGQLFQQGASAPGGANPSQ